MCVVVAMLCTRTHLNMGKINRAPCALNAYAHRRFFVVYFERMQRCGGGGGSRFHNNNPPKISTFVNRIYIYTSVHIYTNKYAYLYMFTETENPYDNCVDINT